jgi:hypothetical protein
MQESRLAAARAATQGDMAMRPDVQTYVREDSLTDAGPLVDFCKVLQTSH